MNQKLQQLNLTWGGDLSLTSLLLNLAVGVILAILLRWHFKRFGSTLTNREEFANVFPFVLLTTVLIITVVKASLALSLGLVGALSIVRFRTPIKEPEELAYLFMAIAIGLGLGADRLIATVVASLCILTVIALLKYTKRSTANRKLYLSVDWQSDSGENIDRYLERLNEVMLKHLKSVDLRRFDARKESAEATYLIDTRNIESLSRLVDDLRQTFPSIGVSFIDQNNMPSI